MLQCKRCNKVFSSRQSLEYHLNKKAIKCDVKFNCICGNVSKTKTEYIKHSMKCDKVKTKH